MTHVLLIALPLALAAALSPSGLLFVMLILSEDENPKLKALKFVLGATVFLVAFAAFIFLTVKQAVGATSHPSKTSAVLDIVFAVLIAAIVTRNFLTRHKTKPEKTHTHRPYLLLGFVYMLVNVSSLIPFAAAVKLIATSRLAVWEHVGALAVIVVVAMSLIAFPVVVTYALPEKSQRILGPTTRFFKRYGTTIANVYFLIMAVYLLAHGIAHL